jgi:hypothetical protein
VLCRTLDCVRLVAFDVDESLIELHHAIVDAIRNGDVEIILGGIVESETGSDREQATYSAHERTEHESDR